jgi:hypothetical protein
MRFAVIRYGGAGTSQLVKEDMVAVFSSLEKARTFVQASEEADEMDYDIEQHTVDDPAASAP